MGTSLVFDRREELKGKPGTHALVCGISRYPFLEEPGPSVARLGLGAKSVDFVARTAAGFAQWLLDHKDDLSVPLASCRVLLAPSPEEEADCRKVGGDIPLPTLAEFLVAASEWRRDASTHRDGMTMLFLAAHGYSFGRDDLVVFLQDFGEEVGSILRNAVSLRSVWDGMVAGAPSPDLARTQLYFIDTGQEAVSLETLLPGARPTSVFDPGYATPSDQSSLIFNSTAPGQTAMGFVGEETLFGKALIDCLDGDAAEMFEGGWAITTTSLAATLPNLVSEMAVAYGAVQNVTVSGVHAHSPVVRLKETPKVDVTILLDKVPADSKLRIQDGALVTKFEAIVVGAEPLVAELPAGIYILTTELPSGTEMPTLFQVTPPRAQVTPNV